MEPREYWDSCSSPMAVSFPMGFCIFGKLNQELIKMLQQECGLLQTIHNLPERQQYSFHFEAYGRSMMFFSFYVEKYIKVYSYPNFYV